MTPRVAVIGAGAGGLAVALRLLAAGCEVTVIERRDRVGGWLDRSVDGPFAWDTGPTTIDDQGPVRRLFDDVGRRFLTGGNLEHHAARPALRPRRSWGAGLPGRPLSWPGFLASPSAAWRPAGGPAAVAVEMASAVATLGGRLVCADAADEIIVYGGRVRVVRTISGAEYAVDAVVANGDPIQTRRRLLRSTPRPFRTHVHRHRPGASSLILRLGLDRRYPRLGPRTSIAGPEPLWLQAAIDPASAPDGGTALSVVLPVPAGYGVDDPAALGALRDRLIRFLELEVGLDGLQRAIVVEHRIGPAAVAEGFDSYRGSVFGSRPAGAGRGQTVRDPAIQGLFHVGSDVGGGNGLMGALRSAEVMARLVGGREP